MEAGWLWRLRAYSEDWKATPPQRGELGLGAGWLAGLQGQTSLCYRTTANVRDERWSEVCWRAANGRNKGPA